MRRGMIILVVVMLCVASVLGACAGDKVGAAVDFYKTNTISLVVPYGPGGGTDRFARVIAGYWTEASNGVSKIEVNNMPGGGTLVGMNHVYAAKPDGLTVAANPSGTSLYLPTLLNEPAVKFDLTKIEPIGEMPYEPAAFAVGTKTSYKSMTDVQKTKNFKGAAVYGGNSMGMALLFELFGMADASVISTYTSGPDVGLAVGRGEVDAMVFTMGSIRENVASGIIKEPLVLLDFKRHSAFPNTPALPELIKLSSEQEKLFKLWVTAGIGGVCTWVAPSVPEDRREFLRQTWDKLVTLKDVQEKIIAQQGGWQSPKNYKDLAADIKTVVATSKEDAEKFKQIVNKYHKR